MPVTRLVPPEDWPTLGWEVIDWLETYLCHGPGDVQGEPLEFDDEFVQITLDLYRLFPKGHRREGRRVVQYGGVSMPKGRAKSEWAGALCCAELVGPVRFGGWDAQGKPVGRPVTYPFIRPLATEQGQTGHTFGNVYVMLDHAAEHHARELKLTELDLGATRILLGKNGKNGEVRPSTAGAASKDGGKESFCVGDEPHLYILPELRNMHAMVRRNSVKRNNPNRDDDAQSWMLVTTTMFEPGQDSVAESLYEEAEKEVLKPSRRFYGFCWHHREGFEVVDPDDDEAILASLSEAYGPAATVNSPTGHMDPEIILTGEFRAPGSVWAECVRYFLNRKHQGEHKAIDPITWKARGDARRNPTPGDSLLLWFDGSEKGKGNDHTVLGYWTVGPGKPHCGLIEAWEPVKEPTTGEYKIQRQKVRKKVAEVRETFRVVRMVCDPHKWVEQIDDWTEEFGDSPYMGAAKEYEPVVLTFDTSKASKMGPAIDRFREGLDENLFTHDDTPEFRWYALNALLTKAQGHGDYHALVKEKHPLKIDALVGAVIGYDELANLPEEFERQEPSIADWDDILAELEEDDDDDDLE